ncbi:MAG: peptidoglycan editing factor PgeF [Halothece sp.]
MAFSSTFAQSAMSNWEYHVAQGISYFKCDLLAGFSHGFLTRECAGLSLSQLTRCFSPEAKPYRTKQVHGKTIVSPSQMPLEDTPILEGDGLCSDGKKQALWVASADCTPVLIADVRTGKVGAVHAGWRGTALSILPSAIAHFLSDGSQLLDLRVALGPAISGEVYQVSENVAVEVGKSLFPNLGEEAILEQLWQFHPSPLLRDSQQGKVRLDVRRVNFLQLENMGFHPEQIAVSPHCTYQQAEHFFSYRRSREKAVQWSGIVSNA